MLTRICTWWFDKKGWKLENSIPRSLNKFMLPVAPHTSYMDFFVGVAVRKKLGIDIKFLAKSEIFRWPIGGFLKAMGGYPVNRSRNTRMVDVVTDLYASKERFAIAITPEGTRRKVDKWKTGFYRIAMAARVPIVLAGIDYAGRRVVFSDPMEVTGNMEADFEKYRQFFIKCQGYHPEKGIF